MALAEKLDKFTAFLMQQQKQEEEIRQRKLMASLSQTMQQEIGSARNLTELSQMTSKHIQTALKMGAPDLVRYAGAFADIRKEAMMREERDKGAEAYANFMKEAYGGLQTGIDKNGNATYMKNSSQWQAIERLPIEERAKALEQYVSLNSPKMTTETYYTGKNGEFRTKKFATTPWGSQQIGDYTGTGDNLMTKGITETDIQPGQAEAEGRWKERREAERYQRSLSERQKQPHGYIDLQDKEGNPAGLGMIVEDGKGGFRAVKVDTGEYTTTKGQPKAVTEDARIKAELGSTSFYLKDINNRIKNMEYVGNGRQSKVDEIATAKVNYFKSRGLQNSKKEYDFEYENQYGFIDETNEDNVEAWNYLKGIYGEDAMYDFKAKHDQKLMQKRYEDLMKKQTQLRTGGLNGRGSASIYGGATEKDEEDAAGNI